MNRLLLGCRSFMEQYDPSWSPNEGDSALRYQFQNQPDVSAWNCERLADAFSSLVGEGRLAGKQVVVRVCLEHASCINPTVAQHRIDFETLVPSAVLSVVSADVRRSMVCASD